MLKYMSSGSAGKPDLQPGITRGDTIFAPASAPGRAGVAVFRISGPEARRALSLCVGDTFIPRPREASLRKLHNPKTHEAIDRALVLFFENPDSFTGEDVVEFHTHGGRAVAQAVIAALQSLPGFRMAESGEFARRAFENGKLDLTEAEAIADLVDAETESQRKQALRQMEGALGALYEGWRETLSRALAHFEASIDFADDDLPKDAAEKQLVHLRALASDIARHLDDRHRGERLREGFFVTILGAPNAGKSSLLNALARREAAIVSPTPGTTRDAIEVHLDLSGYPVTLCDTAGLHESVDAIESEGIRRALKRAEQADLKLLVFDGGKWPACDTATLALADASSVRIVNKSDLVKGAEDEDFLFLSAKTGEGIPELLHNLVNEIEQRFGGTAGSPPLTRQRHRAALEECLTHIRRACDAPAAELRAEDARLALRALGRITGRVDVEDLLDMIFRDFCIGK
jgi:tRNA modification GTPase